MNHFTLNTRTNRSCATPGRLGRGLPMMAVALSLVLLAAPPALADYNEVVRQDQDRMFIGFMSNYVIGMAPGVPPPISVPADAASWGLDLALKYVPPVVQAPPGIGFEPNNSAPGQRERCYLKERVKRGEATYSNLLGFDKGRVPADLDWFPLTPWVAPGASADALRGRGPVVRHRNSDVRVKPLFSDAYVLDPSYQPDQGGPAGLRPRKVFAAGEDIYLHVGRHQVSWQAETLLSPWLHEVPYFLVGLSPPVYRALSKSKGRQLAFDILLEAGLIGLSEIDALGGEPHHGVENFSPQFIDVYDLTSPTITGGRPSVTLEAIDIGGAWAHRYLDDLREELTVYDECDRPVDLRVDYSVSNQDRPRFWPIGETVTLKWTARDPGPNREGRSNSTEWSQQVVVRDTKPPLLLPPPHRVVEIASGARGDKARVPLGNAAVFDLADQRVSIAHDARGCGGEASCDAPRFDIDARTKVRWTATDGSGNRARRNQWVTLKRKGTNTRPLAVEPAQVRAVSYEPTDITLTGIDRDMLSGRTDPLSFEITRQPENGFFVAPLLPFFISDYRVENGLSYDELVDRYCIPKGAFYDNTIPPETIYEPQYIDVRDDGTTYVLQLDPQCPGVNSGMKVSKFDGKGNYLTSVLVGGNDGRIKRIRIAPDGNIHVFRQKLSAGDPSATLMIFDADLNRLPGRAGSLRVEDGQAGYSPRVMNGIQTKSGLIYAIEAGRLAAYRPTGTDENYGAEVKYLGRLEGMLGYQTSGGQGVFSIALDSEENLYVTGPDVSLVYKFTPSEWDPAVDRDAFVPGKLIGWMGRCTGGENCRFDPLVPADPDSPDDPASGRSTGFNCTNETCQRSYPYHGDRPGQFHDPRGLGIDPNDNLYITDYENLRVQRFTSEGFFAGVARSECDGSCFVLGDFSKPLDISVNSTHFYVLDRDFDLLHSFEITPITDVSDDAVTVTYQSEDGYTGTDRFRFAVNDGLLKSASAPVTIKVVRNHRRPLAESFALTEMPGPNGSMMPILEDAAEVPVTLRGKDRDPEDQPYLVYKIVTPPANGRLKGSGARRIYVPKRNFFGQDSFTYLVSDRKTSSRPEDSAVATVTIDVKPVNDAPAFSRSVRSVEAGLGFPLDVMAELDDVDIGDAHRVVVDWGDGAVDRQADEIDDGPVIAQGRAGAAVMARHTYLSPGQRYARICVTDAPSAGFGTQAPIVPLTSCSDPRVTAIQGLQVNIQPMTNIVAVVNDSLEKQEDETGALRAVPIADGSPITYIVDVINTLPDSAAGAGAALAARDVVLRMTMTDHMRLASKPPGCGVSERRIRCRIGAMGKGESRRLQLGVELDGTAPGDLDLELLTRAFGEGQDANGRAFTGSAVPIAFNPDADGDGDGRVNRVDVFPGDPDEWQDTDGDGVGNNRDSDDDDDLMPDAWEDRHGLNARKRSDRNGDLDGDGVKNANEFLLGTDPTLADTDHDNVDDAADNCPLRFNADQRDLDEDSVGNHCDEDFARYVVTIDSIAGNKKPEIATLSRRANGVFRLQVHDSASGKTVWWRKADFLDGGWTARKLLERRARLMVLATHVDGTTRVFLLNARNGELVNEIDFLHRGWTTVDAAVMPAAGGSGEAGIAVLGINREGASSVEIRDLTGAGIKRLPWHGPAWTPIALRRVPDFDGDGTDEAAVLAQKDDGSIVVTLRSLGNEKQLARHTFFEDGWRARDLHVLRDVNGKGAKELAVLAQHRDGRIVAALLDSKNGNQVARIRYSDGGRAPFALSSTTDLDGKGTPEVAALVQRLDGRIEVETRDALKGKLVRRTAYLGPSWVPQSLLRMESKDGEAFMVLGTDGETGEGRLQIRDATSGKPGGNLLID